MKAQDHQFIHPEDAGNISYWSKKWGVSIHQLNSAIIDTGSLNTSRLKDYLKKDIWFYSAAGVWKLLKHKMRLVH